MLSIEELRKSRDKAQVAYHEFVLHTRQGKDGLFCFFEGKDNPYYIPRIKRFTDKYHPIRCNGRDQVLESYRLIIIHSEYDKYKKAFFIDRDFNQPLQPCNPPIFETPCYSIENFYVSADAFKEILKNKFYLSEVSDDFVICLMLYMERQKEFHRAMILFNAWYACLIEIRNATGNKTGADLRKINIFQKGFIDFTSESISAKYDFAKIKETFPDAIDVSENVLNAKIAEFTNCDHCKVFRGKYEMYFLIRIIELILQDSKNDKKHIKKKIKFDFGERLSNEQAMDIFSAYAETPESLNDYLIQVIKNN